VDVGRVDVIWILRIRSEPNRERFRQCDAKMSPRVEIDSISQGAYFSEVKCK
jgi:hypothetical protein